MKRNKFNNVFKVNNWLLLSAVVYCAALLFDFPEDSLQRLSTSYDTEQFDEVINSNDRVFEFFSSREINETPVDACYKPSNSVFLAFILNRKYRLILKRLTLDYPPPSCTFQIRHYYPTDDDHEIVA